MRSEKVKKIINELLSYLLDLKAKEITIKLEENKKHIKIEMINNIEGIDESVINDLEEKLNSERMIHIEELYWKLLGENGDSNQMYLLGNMIDSYDIVRDDEDYLKITIYRNIK